jgi:hypothetical protein
MARIYVSSTYQDLRGERQAVINAVRLLGHTVVSMEDYHAKDDRPLDRCRDDVRSCQGLISIVAFRYGYIPRNERESITHLEYLTACEPPMAGRVRRLVFLLRENAIRSVESVDQDRQQVIEFRQKLREERSIEEFSSLAELSAEVRRAVEREFGVLPSRFGLLPYLIDRTEQLRKVDTDLELRQGETSKPPFLFLVPGEDVQCPDKFVEVAIQQVVGKYAEVSGEEQPVKRIFVSWPGDSENVAAEFLTSLGKKLGLPSGHGRDQILLSLQNHPCIVAIHSRVLTSDWNKGQTEDQIETFLKLWSEWKELVSRRPIVVFLELKYELRNTSLLNRFRYTRRNAHIRDFLAPFAKGERQREFPRVVLRTLTELSPSGAARWRIGRRK